MRTLGAGAASWPRSVARRRRRQGWQEGSAHRRSNRQSRHRAAPLKLAVLRCPPDPRRESRARRTRPPGRRSRRQSKRARAHCSSPSALRWPAGRDRTASCRWPRRNKQRARMLAMAGPCGRRRDVDESSSIWGCSALLCRRCHPRPFPGGLHSVVLGRQWEDVRPLPAAGAHQAGFAPASLHRHVRERRNLRATCMPRCRMYRA